MAAAPPRRNVHRFHRVALLPAASPDATLDGSRHARPASAGPCPHSFATPLPEPLRAPPRNHRATPDFATSTFTASTVDGANRSATR